MSPAGDPGSEWPRIDPETARFGWLSSYFWVGAREFDPGDGAFVLVPYVDRRTQDWGRARRYVATSTRRSAAGIEWVRFDWDPTEIDARALALEHDRKRGR